MGTKILIMSTYADGTYSPDQIKMADGALETSYFSTRL
jgi:hypothetical protein